MSGKIKTALIIGIIAFVIITNFEFFFSLFKHIALILFVPLVVLLFQYIKNDK